eukprot:1138848-Pelagomonas_calceolata.AAC.17
MKEVALMKSVCSREGRRGFNATVPACEGSLVEAPSACIQTSPIGRAGQRSITAFQAPRHRHGYP